MLMLSGMLASVLLTPTVGVIPNARMTVSAVWTIGAFRDISPNGRSPINCTSMSILPWDVDRARFSSSAASCIRCVKFSTALLSSSFVSERISTSIQDSKGIEFTEVPPPTTPTLKVVFGVWGTCIFESFARCLYLCCIHCAKEFQQHSQRARIITHSGRVELGAFAPHSHVCSFGKYGIEMSRDSD